MNLIFAGNCVINMDNVHVVRMDADRVRIFFNTTLEDEEAKVVPFLEILKGSDARLFREALAALAPQPFTPKLAGESQ